MGPLSKSKSPKAMAKRRKGKARNPMQELQQQQPPKAKETSDLCLTRQTSSQEVVLAKVKRARDLLRSKARHPRVLSVAEAPSKEAEVGVATYSGSGGRALGHQVSSN